jgi:hypothetical protein
MCWHLSKLTNPNHPTTPKRAALYISLQKITKTVKKKLRCFFGDFILFDDVLSSFGAERSK